MYNYFISSCGIVLITISVWTSEWRFINTSNFPIDFISFEGCIKEGLILTLSISCKTLDISVGFTDP